MAEEKVLKRSKIGMEVELALLDKDGKMSNEAPKVIKKVKKQHPKINIYKEIGHNMLELGCFPHVETHGPAFEMLNSTEIVNEIVEKLDLRLFSFGSYPGTFERSYNREPKYQIKEKILGKEKAEKALNSFGFHCHYTLPKGVFDPVTKYVKILKNSKIARSMVGSYNLAIAADPALVVFSQSSPFSENNHLAKDMRVMLYRGGRKLHTNLGLYSNHQQFAGLPPYKQTLQDLLHSVKRRTIKWFQLVKKADPKTKPSDIYPYPLDISWNPVKINKLGTLEQRGMDTNLPSINFANMILYKYAMRKIQREFIQVLPTDHGLANAFKIEDNMLFIPPHTTVRNRLQKASVYQGFRNKELHSYAKKFYKFAKNATPKKFHPLIKPIEEMIDSKKSTADKLLDYAKRKGLMTDDNKLRDSDAQEIALYSASMLKPDIKKARKNLSKLMDL
jgi:carboxylate-amine ligase